MNDFSYDYDSDDVLFHYGNGFAGGTDGTQYMEISDDLVVDLNSNEVHYSPHGQIDPVFCSAGTRKKENKPKSDGRMAWSTLTAIFVILAILFIVLCPLEKGQIAWSP